MNFIRKLKYWSEMEKTHTFELGIIILNVTVPANYIGWMLSAVSIISFVVLIVVVKYACEALFL